MKITDIIRYPVKGLRADTLHSAYLSPGAGIKGDRTFAITHDTSAFDHQNPTWVPRRNFLVVAHSPMLASVACVYDESNNTVTLTYKNHKPLTVSLNSANTDSILDEFFQDYASAKQKGPFKLASLGDNSMTDSPNQSISIMNLKSLNELERETGWNIDKARFRGNVWFEGDSAWEERSWVGKTLDLGSCKLRITEEIMRCAAVDVDPYDGVRDLPVLKALSRKNSDVTFGVLGEIEDGGSCAIGGRISISKSS